MRLIVPLVVAMLSLPVAAIEPIDRDDPENEFEEETTPAPVTQPEELKEYHTPSEVYSDIVDWEEESGHKLKKNIRICIDEDCELYFHHEEDNYNYSTIRLKKGKKTKGAKSAAANIKSIIGMASSGVGMGGTVTIKNIKVTNADGSSWEIGEITVSGGVGLGQKAPVPGEEDGKQVHHK